MLWLVALGSAIGGVSRYLLVPVAQRWYAAGFPGGTLTVNILGSLLIGVIVRLATGPLVTPETRIFLTVGICGGFTTFSSFSIESVELMQSGQWARAAIYVLASVALCLLATFVGWSAGGLLIPALPEAP